MRETEPQRAYPWIFRLFATIKETRPNWQKRLIYQRIHDVPDDVYRQKPLEKPNDVTNVAIISHHKDRQDITVVEHWPHGATRLVVHLGGSCLHGLVVTGEQVSIENGTEYGMITYRPDSKNVDNALRLSDIVSGVGRARAIVEADLARRNDLGPNLSPVE